MNSVCQQIKEELINWEGTHLSVMEMSHRSPEYLSIHNKLINNLRTLLNVPKNYEILLMQGGATLQYSAVPLNLLSTNQATYLITGQFSQAAFNEAKKFCIPQQYGMETNCSSYLYYTDNETNDGIQINEIPKSNAFLVCDMTSSLGTKCVDINQYGCIFASLQCNFGMAGLCLVIIRENLINHNKKIPSMASYKVMKDYNSIYNTIPCFNVYVAEKYVQFLLDNFDLQTIEQQQIKKSQLIYDFLDSQIENWIIKVQNVSLRSKNNIIFKHHKGIIINQENIISLENGWYNIQINISTSLEQIEEIIKYLNELKLQQDNL